MNDLIWAGIWAMLLKNAVDIAQMAGLALAYLLFALMCFDWAARFYDKIKQECDLERLLDTPQKRGELMEGITTFEFPEPGDEGPSTMICPLCGALYPAFKMRCNYDKGELQPFRKPITEPLKPVEMLEVPTEEEDAALLATEEELERVRHELEEKAYEYSNRRCAYSFSEEEALSIYNLYNKVRGQSQKEQKAS